MRDKRDDNSCPKQIIVCRHFSHIVEDDAVSGLSSFSKMAQILVHSFGPIRGHIFTQHLHLSSTSEVDITYDRVTGLSLFWRQPTSENPLNSKNKNNILSQTDVKLNVGTENNKIRLSIEMKCSSNLNF